MPQSRRLRSAHSSDDPQGSSFNIEVHVEPSTDTKNRMKLQEMLPGGLSSQHLSYLVSIVGIAISSVTLGLAMPEHLPAPWSYASSILGWSYMLIWSLSFYPQLVVNAQRRSVVGLSFDFCLLNFIGFLAYSFYSLTLYTNADVQEQYQERHHGKSNGVRIHDVLFAVHAAAATAVTLLQIAVYERGGQTFSKLCLAAAAAIVAGCGAVFVAAESNALPDVQLLDLVYVIGFVKIGITTAKYLPQALLNFSRKSTDGFAIGPILCDISGSFLSLGQQVLDSTALADWQVMTGNPIKLLLAFVSIVYDIILMVQHYILYPEAEGSLLPETHRPATEEGEWLLANGVASSRGRAAAENDVHEHR